MLLRNFHIETNSHKYSQCLKIFYLVSINHKNLRIGGLFTTQTGIKEYGISCLYN